MTRRLTIRDCISQNRDGLADRLAGELGWPDAARWIEEHPKEYAEGVFRGFIVDPQGGKS